MTQSTHTVLGDKSRFAIEAELAAIEGKWYFGHLRFWAGTQPFGDYDDTTDLATSVRYAKTFLAASARRARPDLDSLPPDKIFWLLYGRFVDSVPPPLSPREDRVIADVLQGWGDIAPFLLDDVGESSLRDKWSVLVVRGQDGSDRIIIYDWKIGTSAEFVVGPGICDQVLTRYCEWLEASAGIQFIPVSSLPATHLN